MDKINWGHKYVKIIGVVVLIVLFLWLVVGGKRSANEEEALTEGENVDTSIVDDSAKSPDSAASSTPKTNTQVSLSYQEALNKYASSRIQFNDSCQATPSQMTVKNGATIMLDNRSASSRKIKLGSTYTVAGYGFKVVKASASTFPSTILIDCGASQNVATVIVQK